MAAVIDLFQGPSRSIAAAGHMMPIMTRRCLWRIKTGQVIRPWTERIGKQLAQEVKND
jgi:hypothetical protein